MHPLIRFLLEEWIYEKENLFDHGNDASVSSRNKKVLVSGLQLNIKDVSLGVVGSGKEMG